MTKANYSLTNDHIYKDKSFYLLNLHYIEMNKVKRINDNSTNLEKLF